jgi:hypothetical protein
MEFGHGAAVRVSGIVCQPAPPPPRGARDVAAAANEMTSDSIALSTRVQACRDEIAGQLRAYRDLVGASSKASGMSLVRIDAALAAFEPAFFNNLLIALDARFADQPHAAGGARAEVRLLAVSLMAHGGVVTCDDASPTPLLRLDAGDRIALNADDFQAVCDPFLDELGPVHLPSA